MTIRDISSAAQTCRELRMNLRPLLDRLAAAHTQRCDEFGRAFWQIAKPGVEVVSQGTQLSHLARTFDPAPLAKQKAVEIFEILLIRACCLSGEPRQSPVIVFDEDLPDNHLLNDANTREMFDALLVLATKLLDHQRATLIDNSIKHFSQYRFASIESEKNLMAQNFLLKLVKLLPSEDHTHTALSKMFAELTCSGSSNFLQYPVLETSLDLVDSVENEAQRCDTLCKFIEQYPANSLRMTERQGICNHLLKTVDSLKDESLRYRALCTLVEHYPPQDFPHWQKLAPLTATLNASANLLSPRQRGLALSKIIDKASFNLLYPSEITDAIKAMLTVVDSLPEDQKRLTALKAILEQPLLNIPMEVVQTVVSALMNSCEKLSKASARDSAKQMIQARFPGIMDIAGA